MYALFNRNLGNGSDREGALASLGRQFLRRLPKRIPILPGSTWPSHFGAIGVFSSGPPRGDQVQSIFSPFEAVGTLQNPPVFWRFHVHP
jgi:hypothetical protein